MRIENRGESLRIEIMGVISTHAYDGKWERERKRDEQLVGREREKRVSGRLVNYQLFIYLFIYFMKKNT